jgi:hypothetical protein
MKKGFYSTFLKSGIGGLLNENNKIRLIGLLTILIAFWLILYLIPELFISIFNTILGNLILIIATLLIFMNNRTYGLLAALLFIIIYRFSHLLLIKEGFTWTKDSELDFLRIQSTINRNTIFDVNMIQETQASQAEVDYFNKNGMWPWSSSVIDLYIEAVRKNPYIRTLPEDAVKYTRTVYNEAAILKILSYQTKEGQFLLTGVKVKNPHGNKEEDLPSGFGDFGYNSGLIGNLSDDVIRCNLKNENNPHLERIHYTGKGGIFNQQTKKVTPMDYHHLETIIPGFKFLSNPCNPCSSMSAKPDYSCKYELKLKNQPSTISSVWNYLWNK